MDRRLQRLAAVAIAGFALVVALHQWGSHRLARLQGSSRTPVAMKQLNGEPLRLAEYPGKVILLDFFASWCTPCRKEIPRLVEWQSKYGASGLQVIGVAMDDNPRDAERFAQEFQVDYPIVTGTVELADQYGGALGLPVNILIGRDGKMVSKHVGETDLPSLEREITTQLANGQ